MLRFPHHIPQQTLSSIQTLPSRPIRFGQGEKAEGKLAGLSAREAFDAALSRYQAKLKHPNLIKKKLLSALKLPVSLTAAVVAYPFMAYISRMPDDGKHSLLKPENAWDYFSNTNAMLDSMVTDFNGRITDDLIMIRPRLALQQGNAKAAFNLYEKAISREPLEPILYLHLGDFASAILADLNGVPYRHHKNSLMLTESAKQSVRDSRIDFKAIAMEAYSRAQALWEARKYDKSLEESSEGLSGFTGSSLASLYEVLGDKDKAVSYRQKAIASSTQNGGKLTSLYRRSLIETYIRFSDRQGALAAAKESALHGDGHYLEQLVREEAKTNPDSDATQAVTKAYQDLLAEHPRNGKLLMIYVLHCENSEQYPLASAALQRALQEPFNPEDSGQKAHRRSLEDRIAQINNKLGKPHCS